MSLFTQIDEDLKQARKAKDELKADTLRMLFAALKNEKIALKKEELSDLECEKIISKEAKKRKDAIAAYEKGGRQELADKESQELEIIQTYLPKQLSEEELSEKIKSIVAANTDLGFGPLMGKVMSEVKGQADGKLVQKILKEQT